MDCFSRATIHWEILGHLYLAHCVLISLQVTEQIFAQLKLVTVTMTSHQWQRIFVCTCVGPVQLFITKFVDVIFSFTCKLFNRWTSLERLDRVKTSLPTNEFFGQAVQSCFSWPSCYGTKNIALSLCAITWKTSWINADFVSERPFPTIVLENGLQAMASKNNQNRNSVEVIGPSRQLVSRSSYRRGLFSSTPLSWT